MLALRSAVNRAISQDRAGRQVPNPFKSGPSKPDSSKPGLGRLPLRDRAGSFGIETEFPGGPPGARRRDHPASSAVVFRPVDLGADRRKVICLTLPYVVTY